MAAKTMDHAKYQAGLRKKTEVELYYIIKDANAAAIANPGGENVGYYLDEVNYAQMELARRQTNCCKKCKRKLTRYDFDLCHICEHEK